MSNWYDTADDCLAAYYAEPGARSPPLALPSGAHASGLTAAEYRAQVGLVLQHIPGEPLLAEHYSREFIDGCRILWPDGVAAAAHDFWVRWCALVDVR